MEIGRVDKLESEGWVRQFTASGHRLQEAVENYRQLGFEVMTIPVKEMGQDGCTVCFDDEHDDTVLILTRKKPGRD